ncbi:hypothetical protein ACFQE8_12275 [Salinirubellus sp. GCM10025818]
MESDEFAEWMERIEAQEGIDLIGSDDVVRGGADSGDTTSVDD